MNSHKKAIWDEAEFTDDKSQLGKAVPTGELFVPGNITLDATKSSLVWVPDAGGKSVRPDMRDLFNGFVHLHQAPPSAILQYARRWGLLFIDSDGTPCAVPFRPRAAIGRDQREDIKAPDKRRRIQPAAHVHLEVLNAWVLYSQRASATLSIAASLKVGRRASPSDWQVLSSLKLGDNAFRDLRRRDGALDLYAMTGCPYSAEWNIDLERRWLAMEVSLWLALGRPGFAMNPGSWQLEVDYNGCLFAAIALQLALTVTSARNLFTCSGCGLPYIRQQKAPKSGQANYCARCGDFGVSSREANDRLRQKKEEARKLRAEGASIREIAERLKVRRTKRSTQIDTVRRWIGEEK